MSGPTETTSNTNANTPTLGDAPNQNPTRPLSNTNSMSLPKNDQGEQPANQNANQNTSQPPTDAQRGNPKKDQNNITPDHPRFKEVVYKMRENERIVNDQAGMLNKLFEQNQQLSSQLTTFTANQTSTQLTNQLQGLQAQKRQLQEEGNWDLVNQLDDQILDIKVKQKTIQNTPKPNADSAQSPHTPQNPQNQQPPQNQQVNPQVAQEAYAAIEVFKASNAWYGSDPILTGAADALDQQLMQDPQWAQASTSARLSEVSNQIKKEFTHKFPGDSITQSMTDAPQSGPAGTTPAAGAELSDYEKQCARRLLPGVDPTRAYEIYRQNK